MSDKKSKLIAMLISDIKILERKLDSANTTVSELKDKILDLEEILESRDKNENTF